jgi:hypothetical protein
VHAFSLLLLGLQLLLQLKGVLRLGIFNTDIIIFFKAVIIFIISMLLLTPAASAINVLSAEEDYGCKYKPS